jgi:predicted ester cyclase
VIGSRLLLLEWHPPREFLGVPASGRRVTVEAWTLDRYQGGQLVESRIIMDVVGLLTQVGAIPAPAGG